MDDSRDNRDETPVFVGAKWIRGEREPGGPMPMFRHAFTLPSAAESATLRVCALGHGEVWINGERVGRDELSPGWTDYRKTCLYVTHDVTRMLRPGVNVVGVVLGKGMYCVEPGRRYKKFTGSFGPLRFILRCDIECPGRQVAVLSGEHWRWSSSPITFSCIYGGEDFDARRDPNNWMADPFDDSTWKHAIECDGPGGRLVRESAPPVRVIRELSPISKRVVGEDAVVYDFGQNLSGRPRIVTNAPAGSLTQIITAELLGDDGLPDQNRTGKPVEFNYIADGRSNASWHPRFSLHGFRYALVRGPQPEAIVAQWLHADFETVGRFECSNPLFNRIHELICNAIRSNVQSVITDCPHREKLGWTEQMYLMAESMLFNFDVSGVLAKSVADMADAQDENGRVPTICPQYTSFQPPWDVFNDSPEWGSAIVRVPWAVFMFTGDDTLIRRHYANMRAWANYLAGRAEDGLIRYGLGDWYDIGPGDPGFSKLTTAGVTGTATHHLNCRILERCAKRLGRADDADRFAAMAADSRKAFRRAFVDSDSHRVDQNSQCALAMAIACELLEADEKVWALGALIHDIRSRSNHITAGDIGFRYVVDALTTSGRSDVMADLLSQPDAPSYAAQLAAGATTLTEAWDANPRSSQNHMMLGHAEQWFFNGLCGIRFDGTAPAGRRVVVAPQVVDLVDWAEANVRGRLAEVKSRWERQGDSILVSVWLSSKESATVFLPDGRRVEIKEGEHRFVSAARPVG